MQFRYPAVAVTGPIHDISEGISSMIDPRTQLFEFQRAPYYLWRELRSKSLTGAQNRRDLLVVELIMRSYSTRRFEWVKPHK